MSKPLPIRYRTRNWSSYTASLRKRGSLLIWLDIRSRIEAKMHCLKAFGERIMAIYPER